MLLKYLSQLLTEKSRCNRCCRCRHGSGTAGAYIVSANGIAAGSFKITVSNVSGGSLSEAIVINYVALKEHLAKWECTLLGV